MTGVLPRRPDPDASVLERVVEVLRGRREDLAAPRGRRLLGAIAASAVIAIALWWLLKPGPEPVEASLPFAPRVTAPATNPSATRDDPETSASVGSERSSSTDLVVHVAGEVQRPGLVTVPSGARIAEVLAAAGGPTLDAQIHALNLAAVVVDGQRILVPHRDQVEVAAVAVAGEDSGRGDGSSTVSINTASAEELDSLPGIGPALARAIVAYREDHGPFLGAQDLLEVPGIGPAKLAALEDLITW